MLAALSGHPSDYNDSHVQSGSQGNECISRIAQVEAGMQYLQSECERYFFPETSSQLLLVRSQSCSKSVTAVRRTVIQYFLFM